MRKIVADLKDDKLLDNLGYALTSSIRRKIILLVSERSYSVAELANILDLALSTVTFHLKILKAAGLVKILPSPSKRGNEKNVSQAANEIYISLHYPGNESNNIYTYSIPVGSYANFDIKPPCGMVDQNGIMMQDHPGIFYSHKRINANLIYFFKGYVEYYIPTYEFEKKEVESLSFSLELCSECPNYNNNWKSDITFWVNDVELLTYQSQGDYGDRRGIYTPEFWSANATQYGFLKKITVNQNGTYLDEELVGNVTIDELKINESMAIKLKIGIKDNAKHVGGINIFGKNFGDYDQDINVIVAVKNSKNI
ncbi:MAG: ArsR family transcriptional regulator [Bacilli bacterium]|nr:ArsR family transcriptional regulator [Bacilli bacterium]